MTRGPHLSDDDPVRELPTPYDLLVHAAKSYESHFGVTYDPERQAVLISRGPEFFDVVISCVPLDQLASLGRQALSAGMAFELRGELDGFEHVLDTDLPTLFDPVEALEFAIEVIANEY